MSSNDPIKDFSQSIGGGLDAPNPFKEGLGKTNGFEKDLFEGTPHEASKPATLKWRPKARVFIIDEDGNEEYEDILAQGANGEVMLGRKEIVDLKGSISYKVYLEWMIPIRPAKKKQTNS
jgi:hypothetical protein